MPQAARQLSHKQELWVKAYLGDAHGNATEAARIAGYTNPEASGKDNLRNPTLLAHVKAPVEKAGVTADMVIAELADVGFSEWRDHIEVIQSDREGNPIRVRMDLSNKVKALELLGKYHQLFTDKQVVDVNVREHFRAVPQSTLDRIFRPADRRADA
jgi:phage terminase small subunit